MAAVSGDVASQERVAHHGRVGTDIKITQEAPLSAAGSTIAQEHLTGEKRAPRGWIQPSMPTR
jgi:hypothetical protein